MKHASVRDLRNHYNRLLSWVEAGEEIVIEKRGSPVAMLVPSKNKALTEVDWSKSAALQRDKSTWRKLTRLETSELLDQVRREF